MTEMVRLTPEQMLVACKAKLWGWPIEVIDGERIAQAQRELLKGWLIKPCYHGCPRHRCYFCMEGLLREAGNEQKVAK